jgi:hypothetical protein
MVTSSGEITVVGNSLDVSLKPFGFPQQSSDMSEGGFGKIEDGFLKPDACPTKCTLPTTLGMLRSNPRRDCRGIILPQLSAAKHFDEDATGKSSSDKLARGNI